MKIMTFIMAAVLLLTMNAGFAQEIVAPGEELAFKVLQETYSQGGNILISPYSLYTALAMAAKGAGGETRAQICAAVGSQDPSFIGIDAASTANAAFIAEEAGVIDAYLDKLSAFQARICALEAGKIDEINAWASQATDGLIDPLLAQPLDENTRLVLLNAISLKAQWETPFKPSATREGTFHSPDKDVTTQFMKGTMSLKYGKLEGMEIVILPYKQDNLNAYFILPDDGSLGAALGFLARSGYGAFANLETTRVRASVPKLDISADNKLSKVLKDNGIVDAFTLDADLSGINGKNDLMIDEVAQKVALKLDEDGTQAAAGTSVTIIPKGMLDIEDVVEFKLDRPFILLIRDEASGQTLFAACIDNPCENLTV